MCTSLPLHNLFTWINLVKDVKDSVLIAEHLLTFWTKKKPLIIYEIIVQVVYGSHITDPVDQQSLSAMVDYWVSPTAIKKEFEVARCMWHLQPSII